MSYDSYILDLQTTHVFLFNFLLQCQSKKGGKFTPAVAGHASCQRQRRAWSIDSNHASQPTLRLDNFLLSRTLESIKQVCQVSCGGKLNFSFQRGSDVQTSGFLWCPVFTNMRNTKEGHKWGLSEMESSEQTIAVAHGLPLSFPAGCCRIQSRPHWHGQIHQALAEDCRVSWLQILTKLGWGVKVWSVSHHHFARILPCVSSSQDHRAQLGISLPDIPRPCTCEAHDRVCRLRWPSMAPGVKTVHDQLCFSQKVSDLTKNWMIEMIEV